MSIKPAQIEVSFTQADKDKLDSVAANAQPQPAIATQAEAEAGLDMAKMMTPLRVKQAIDEFASASGEANTASNVGTGEGIFKVKVGADLQFKSLDAGANISITPTADKLIISATDGAASTTITGTYFNNSGLTINAFTLVRQDTSGNIARIDPSLEVDVSNIIGLLLDTTITSDSGEVLLSGLLKDIATSFNFGDVIYLSKTGGLTATVPDIGVASFVAGDWVVKIGKILKNSDNPTDKDFKLEVEIKAQL